MFAGRFSEIEEIEQSLFQTKNYNPQSFLISGERGIGKSSLLFYVKLLASGAISIDDVDDFKYLAIDIDCSGCSSQLSLIQRVGRTLKRELSKFDSKREAVRSILDWLSKWEALGVRFNNSDDYTDDDEVIEDLVVKIKEFLDRDVEKVDGLIVLIDEIDKNAEQIDLGEFLKIFLEKLSRNECRNVMFGVAGLPNIISKLRSSHESAPRLFNSLQLGVLGDDEVNEVIDRGLEEANRKNDGRTVITSEARQLLANLSEGYPHFIQQFAYSAFAADDDGTIDRDDVLEGAFGKKGALSQLGDKFFDDMYRAITSADYKVVLSTMAEHGDGWLQRKTILDKSGISATNIDNALAALKKREVILADDSRRGFYRLPTRSFAAWIRANKSVEADVGQTALPFS